MTLFNKLTRSKEQREKTRIKKTSSADVIQFSGCKDDQKAADSVEGVNFPSPVLRYLANVGLGRDDGGYELGF
jgi:hypothetical protein